MGEMFLMRKLDYTDESDTPILKLASHIFFNQLQFVIDLLTVHDFFKYVTGPLSAAQRRSAIHQKIGSWLYTGLFKLFSVKYQTFTTSRFSP